MLKDLYKKHQLFFLVVGVLLAGFLVWYFSPIFICVIVAGVVMIIGQPLVERLNRIRIGRFKMPNGLSVTLTLALIVIVLLGILAFIIPLIVKEVNMLTAINPEQVASYFKDEIVQVQAFLVKYGIMAQDDTIVGYLKASVLQVMNVNLVSSLLNNIFMVAGSILFYFFTTLFLAFFFLLDRDMLKNFILVLFPEQYEEKAQTHPLVEQETSLEVFYRPYR